jgi:hypothetical protein
MTQSLSSIHQLNYLHPSINGLALSSNSFKTNPNMLVYLVQSSRDTMFGILGRRTNGDTSLNLKYLLTNHNSHQAVDK